MAKKVVSHECYYTPQPCRCFEVKSKSETHDECSSCGKQGEAFEGRTHRGMPVIATMWTCEPCRGGVEPMKGSY